MENSRKIVIMGVLVALALVCGYVDNVIPFFSMVPGVKLGLANIVILVTLYVMGIKEAILVNLTRVTLAGVLFGTIQSFFFSFSGALLSLMAMIIMMKIENSLSGSFQIKLAIISLIGAIFHIVGQLLVACFFIAPQVLLYYGLYMLIFAGLCGVLISVPGTFIINLINKNSFDME